MINVNDFKPGITFQMDGNIFTVIEANHSKSGRGQAHVKAKVKNLRSGVIITLTFTGGEKVGKAMIDKTEMQYLYDDGTNVVFMDNNTYEQIEIPSSNLKWEKNFFTEGLMVAVQKFEGEVLGVYLPEKVQLKVIQAEGAVKGDTTSGALKRAIVETNLEVMVPLFIKEGDVIVLNTSDGKYDGRA